MSSGTRLPFWSETPDETLARLGTTATGLTRVEAAQRLQRHGPNAIGRPARTGDLALLLAQFKSPIVWLLLTAALLSFFLHDRTDAAIIVAIIGASALLSWWQERGAQGAVRRLLALVQATATVLRDGQSGECPREHIVPGDVVLLAAGAQVPGDCRLLDGRDVFVDEAALTGETFPAEKSPETLPADTPLAARRNVLFAGTHVVSGTARAVVVETGPRTEFGRIAGRLRTRPPETDFERGVRRFGTLVLEVTVGLVIVVFAINVYFARPVLEAFLFSLALAVGLTPQMLPAIISVNLAQGARRMAAKKVIVRRLASIENFGSMTVLCSDKTGTLTEGKVRLHAAIDPAGDPSDRVRLHAFVNASFESGFANPIDEAIRQHNTFDLSAFAKLDEIPYDFLRKRLSILVAHDGAHLLITKGAFTAVLDVCATAEAGAAIVDLGTIRDAIERRFEALSGEGYRVLAVACRDVGSRQRVAKADETGMTLLGLLVLEDPPKAGIAETLAALRALGVTVKVITGDNALVGAALARRVGFAAPVVVTGAALRRMSDEALRHQAVGTDVFAEIEPNQKERVIVALKTAGCVVGFLGDGINDASALHAADVGISVDGAVDVAKEAADLVLLEHDLRVLLDGVREGRTTFANTLKYVCMAVSANFGNMFSMAGASLFLPFLPLLPKQILLTNLLTDLPEMTIGTDRVDPEMIAAPQRWDIGFIRSFMVVFGLLSTVFDYLTFGILLLLLGADTRQFRTGWFMESVISASVVVLVIRSRRPIFRSRPSTALTVATLGVMLATLAFAQSRLAGAFGFERLSTSFVGALALIVVSYVVAAERVKPWFHRRAASAELWMRGGRA